MTAPETIYAKGHGWLVTPEGQNETGAWFVRKRSGHAEYTRTDLSNALIAAAFEAAAKDVDKQHEIHMTSLCRDPAKYVSAWSCTADDIRALTPPDAQAALQAMIDAAVKDAIQAKELNHVGS